MRRERRHESAAFEDYVDDRWRIESQLGYGAFGRVYEARDTVTGATVALKIFNENFDESGYLQELGLMFGEQHPNIVETLSFGYTQGRKFIVYEFVPGGSLRDYLIRYPRITPLEAVGILTECARGLAFAHRNKVVHRDLKPENILLTGNQWPFSVKLCDFGLSARCARDELLESSFGSPAYMAPEQFSGGYDFRVDFYALGVIFYEMLFGRRPLTGDASSISYAHRYLEITLPRDGPPMILSLLRFMLAKNPEDRFQSCEQLIERLEDCANELANGETVSIERPKLPQRRLKECWQARLPGGLHTYAPMSDGSLSIFASRRIVSVAPDGRFIQEARLDDEPTHLLSGGSHEGLTAWIHDDVATVQRRDGSRATWRVPRHVGATFTATFSPDQRKILLAAPKSLTLITADGEPIWTAEIETYGALPPACFSASGQVVWVATEAPRTQLIAISVHGEKLCRTSSPTNDAALVSLRGERVVVGGRGRTELYELDVNGFITNESSATEPIYDLHAMGESLAVSSVGHVEVFDSASLQTQTLAEHPHPQDVTVFSRDGIFQISMESSGMGIRFSKLDER